MYRVMGNGELTMLKRYAILFLILLGSIEVVHAQWWVMQRSGHGGSCASGNDANTVLLIHSNTTDGSTTFVDSGKNAACPHAITVNGHTHHETDYLFPGFGSSSIYFDGTADYLSLADSASWDLGAGDYCVEFKIRYVGALANTGLIGRYASEANTWGLYHNVGAGRLEWYYGNGIRFEYSWVPTLNTPYHVAINRISGTQRIFINGVVLGNNADAANYNTATNLGIGDYGVGFAPNFHGYMTEIAIHVGDAVYPAGGFTPNARPYCD